MFRIPKQIGKPLMLLTLLVVAPAVAPADDYPVELEIESPKKPKKGEEPRMIMYRAGWPLTFKAIVKDEDMLGIGHLWGPQSPGRTFPEPGQPGAIVFEDPDGVWSFGCIRFGCTDPLDETILELYADRGDLVGVEDDSLEPIYPFQHWALADPTSRPEIGGPGLSDGVLDGVGYGADDDFPSLVLLSNVGAGIVLTSLEEGWEPVVPAQRRNLAGFLGNVGYELADQKLRTTITASMIVPRFLFSHTRIVDGCIGEQVYTDPGTGNLWCEGFPGQRVDGGPIQGVAGNDGSIVELRAFLVAPILDELEGFIRHLNVVTDMNGDGVVGAADADLMGWTVLSNEVVFEFKQIGNDIRGAFNPRFGWVQGYCNGGARPDTSVTSAQTDFLYDIDGNGVIILDPDIVCPGGASGTSNPPRG